MSAAYLYDFADRQESLTVTTPAGSVPVASGATYLPSGPLVSLDLANGTTETRAFDDRYFPESIAWSGPPARTWAYDTDAVGNVTSIERTIACAGDVTVSDETFSTDETVESCADLTVGPNVTLTATADVAFRAAGSVAFLNGFSVQTGARMSVEPGAVVDPPELRLFDYQDGPYFLTLGDGPWGERDWTYDRIGNRLTETRNRSGTPETDTYGYTLNGAGGHTPILDEVLLSPSGTADYAWDPAGNLDTLTRGANLLDFTFDDASRMSAIDRASDSVDVLYDGRSFLRSAEDPTSTASVEPLYDSAGLLHGLLEKDSPTGPESRHTLFYLAGRPVAQLTQDAASETWRYLTTDHLGTPLLASDVAGSVTWSGGFEPFGDDFAEGTAGAALANDLFLRFPGQWETELWADASLGTGGLYYNVHRWYTPGTGRYTRPDPWGIDRPEGIGLWYSYAESNPQYFVDPEGLLSIPNFDFDTAFDCFYCLASRAGWGSKCTEESAWITLEPSGGGFRFGCAIWPPTGEREQHTFRGVIPKNTIGQAHTHPVRCLQARARGPRPSSADRTLADTEGFAVCTITPNGIWCYNPNEKKTKRVAPTNWRKGPEQRNCEPCQGISQP